MTVDEMLNGRTNSRGMSSAELSEWKVFFKLEQTEMAEARSGGGGSPDKPMVMGQGGS